MKLKLTGGVILLSFLASSCASILNPNTKEINIYTSEPSKIIFENDTISTVNNKTYIVAKRQKQPVTFKVLKNDTVKTLTLKPRNSIAFYANIPYTYGIGLIPDWNNPKRYTYRSRVFINSAETVSRVYRYDQSPRKNAFFLHVSLPHANILYFKPEGNGEQYSAGFMGISVGLDYYHRENQYLHASVSTVTDFILPFPAPYDNFSEHDHMFSDFVSLSNNHVIHDFTVGYGLSYAKNIWVHHGEWGEGVGILKKHYAAGLIFSTYMRVAPRFNIGLIYRPTFFRFGVPDQFEYEHYLGLDLAWKIRLTR